MSRKQLHTLRTHAVVERLFPDTYRVAAVSRTHAQMLHAALLWAGDGAVATGRSAGLVYGLEGVTTTVPEIAIPAASRRRTPGVVVVRGLDPRALMSRQVRGMPVAGVEATLVAIARFADGESFEIACEDARRKRLTSVPALRAYLDRFGTHGRRGVAPLRRLLEQLDPDHPANSQLEVRTRRLLVDQGLSDFVREFPLAWNGRTYRFDFAFPANRTILETNGRRWHDDAGDYEHDHEKWSVPGRHGYRLVFATWDKVTQRPDDLVDELRATIAAC